MMNDVCFNWIVRFPSGFFQTPKPFTSVQELKQPQFPNSTDHENRNAPKILEVSNADPKSKSCIEESSLPKPSSSGPRPQPNHVQSMLNPSPVRDVDFIENTPEKRKKVCKLRQTSSFAKRKLDEEQLNPTVKRIKEDVVAGDVNSDNENDDDKFDERRGAKAEALPTPVSEKNDLIVDKGRTGGHWLNMN